jgi:hypothetical protein
MENAQTDRNSQLELLRVLCVLLDLFVWQFVGKKIFSALYDKVSPFISAKKKKRFAKIKEVI